MRNLDLSPLYRSAIGFDRLASLLDTMTTSEQNQPAYPPYNIELTGEDAYRISMAVAGFDQSELDIHMEQNRLTVSGKKVADEEKRNFLHRGIAARNFERRFQLADHVRVTDAQLVNGLLHIELVREIPEAMKPRKIEISSGNLLQSSQADEAQTGERETSKKSVPVGEQAA
ncbi:Hsp20 family protein [Microbulbifer salipaludis]|uniref:Hsp20 family protein n=1 Tax=Microbulbifer salipaludis TaxID=187980 RepID=A0ABS3EA36_9GAMM|nr:Hsp20 family protein [Microbulbifer salipaludis]MBN8431924.1 Hsp20 family protein [Microbulbifer salipaludis]